MYRKLVGVLAVVVLLGGLLAVLAMGLSLSSAESTVAAAAPSTEVAARPHVHYRMPARAQIEWRLREAGRITDASTEQEIIQAVEEWQFKFAKASPSWVRPEAREQALANEQAWLAGNVKAQAATEITASVLAIPVEFDAVEEFTIQRPNAAYTACFTVTELFSGPLQGEIPYPGGSITDTVDNNTAFYPSTESEDYERLIFGTIGITEPLRQGDPHVNDGAGVDLSGLTVQTYYDAQSDNSVTVTGTVAPWVAVTHTEAYYGIDICVPGFEPPATADGHPGLGRPADLVIDAAEALKAEGGMYADYNFWKEFDNDDDGWIDTLWIIHAGRGQEAGGGAEGEDAIWSHSSNLIYYYEGGYTIHDNGTSTTTDDLKIGPFTFQPEDGDLGVFTEEFGHNFFHFPDLYTTDASNSVGWWSHMSAGSWGGELGGTRPVNMPLFFRTIADCGGSPCGWADPVKVLNYTTEMTNVVIGQAGVPAGGTTTGTPGGDTIYEGIRIDLPDQEEQIMNNAGEGQGAWSTSGDEMDNTLTEMVDLTGETAPITLTVDAYWDIEVDWDYGYVRVSTDGEAWTNLDDLDGILRETNPNGNNLGHGLTGQGFGTLRFDLSDYAGEEIWLRFYYRTDVAVSNPGWWIDNVMISGDVLDEDFEDGFTGWTNEGWRLVPYTETYEHYYLVEWRNDNGFDESLLYPYNTNYSDQDEWRVDRVPANVPAAVVMYRNTRYDFSYALDPQLYDPPSLGSKYGLLVVDPNFWPVEPEIPLAYGFSGRLQSLDAGLAMQDQPDYTLEAWSVPTKTLVTSETIAGKAGVTEFNDAMGYYPGLFFGPPCDPGYVCWWDRDASVVIPSRDGQVYSTRITDYDRNPFYPLYGATVAGLPLGSGNPGDVNAQFGLHIELVEKADDGSWGRVVIYNQAVDFETTHTQELTTLTPGTYTVTYQTVVENTGTMAASDVYVTYTLDADLTPVSFEDSGVGTVEFPTDLVWWTDELVAGETVTLTLVATYTAELPLSDDTLVTMLEANDGTTNRGPWMLETDVGVPARIYMPLIFKNTP